MTTFMDGNAIVYCEGAFNTPNGKTAHGLVRRTWRYGVSAIVDSRYAGKDAGEVLDGKANAIPIFGNIAEAMKSASTSGISPSYLVVGLAPDGGRLDPRARQTVMDGIRMGLNVDCGLHDFLSDDQEIASLAREEGVHLRDVRKTPSRKDLHSFTGRIEEVDSFKNAA